MPPEFIKSNFCVNLRVRSFDSVPLSYFTVISAALRLLDQKHHIRIIGLCPDEMGAEKRRFE